LIVQCPSCQSRFSVDASKIKSPLAKGRCSVCEDVFFLLDHAVNELEAAEVRDRLEEERARKARETLGTVTGMYGRGDDEGKAGGEEEQTLKAAEEESVFIHPETGPEELSVEGAFEEEASEELEFTAEVPSPEEPVGQEEDFSLAQEPEEALPTDELEVEREETQWTGELGQAAELELEGKEGDEVSEWPPPGEILEEPFEKEIPAEEEEESATTDEDPLFNFDEDEGIGLPIEEEPGQQAAAPAAPPEGETEATDEAASLKAELESARAQMQEYLDGWQRERAAFANYRRRVEEQQEQARRDLIASIAKRYLEVLDDLELALKNKPTEGEGAAWAEGIELIYRKMLAVLEAEGVKPMETRPGDPFDPRFHEAITHEPHDEHDSDDHNRESGHLESVARQTWAQVFIESARFCSIGGTRRPGPTLTETA